MTAAPRPRARDISDSSARHGSNYQTQIARPRTWRQTLPPPTHAGGLGLILPNSKTSSRVLRQIDVEPNLDLSSPIARSPGFALARCRPARRPLVPNPGCLVLKHRSCIRRHAGRSLNLLPDSPFIFSLRHNHDNRWVRIRNVDYHPIFLKCTPTSGGGRPFLASEHLLLFQYRVIPPKKQTRWNPRSPVPSPRLSGPSVIHRWSPCHIALPEDPRMHDDSKRPIPVRVP